jgi:hypothetical protein
MDKIDTPVAQDKPENSEDISLIFTPSDIMSKDSSFCGDVASVPRSACPENDGGASTRGCSIRPPKVNASLSLCNLASSPIKPLSAQSHALRSKLPAPKVFASPAKSAAAQRRDNVTPKIQVKFSSHSSYSFMFHHCLEKRVT